LDGSVTRILPEEVTAEGTTVRVCFRPGAFAATRRSLLAIEGFGDADAPRRIDEVGELLLVTALEAGRTVSHPPEPLVRWNEPGPEAEHEPGSLQLRWRLQAIDALARTPIPDGALLTRYAVAGGVAAAQLGDWPEARRLFRLARRLEPTEPRHWARWAVACVPPVGDRVWGRGQVAQPAPVAAG